mgnify:CR=1 FL=1
MASEEDPIDLWQEYGRTKSEALRNALEAEASPRLVGSVTLPDGRQARPVFELMASRYLDEQYAPDQVAARIGIPATDEPDRSGGLAWRVADPDAVQARLAAARAIIGTLDEAPLYGRVDMLRGEGGGLLLMELEVIEPYLYPVEGPELGELMAAGIARRLGIKA